MSKIILLAGANIRKTKGHTISLLLMFFISAMLLNIGMLIFNNFGSYFDSMAEELHSADVYYLIPEAFYNDRIDAYLKEHDNIKELADEETLWGTASMKFRSDFEDGRAILICDMEKERSLSRYKFIGQHLPAEGMSVYLPYIFQLDGGYKLNDTLEMTFKNKSFTFTVKGFIEDVLFSSPETGPVGFYVSHDSYEKIYKELGEDYKARLIFTKQKEVNKEIEAGIRSLIDIKDDYKVLGVANKFFSLDLPLIEMSRVLIPNMISVMVVSFAAIIVVVCLIVIRFRINNSIEEDMTKIGSLKAVGYTSRQIILSIAAQFTVIALIGSISGIGISYLTIPALSDVFARQSGLYWVQGFDGGVSGFSLMLILLIVGAVAILSARKIKKLHPIIALRGGIVTHSFRRNHIPLHKSRGALPFVLAIKSMVQNRKQSIMIAIILIAVSFAQSFAVIMFYNTTIDATAFLETPGIELSNALAVLRKDENQAAVYEQIGRMEEVRKIQYIDETTVNVDGIEILAFVMGDYSCKETVTVYEGRYPKHGNEVALAGYLSAILKKEIGDEVTISLGDRKEAFLVTGLSQGAYMGGMNISLTYEGMLKLSPDFSQQSLNIYLNKGEDAGSFVEKLRESFGEAIISSLNMDENMEDGAEIYTSIVSKLGIAILLITMAVVMLVLYFVINSSVVRRRRELGIQKAIGYTTLQLMNQLSISFLLPIILGVGIGSYLGASQTNNIMSMAQRSMGIMRSNYIVIPTVIAAFGLATVLLSYLTSILITYRVRKISAYALVTE